MKFNLKSYDDLGKCAYGTLLEEYDTEKNVILLRGKEVPIGSLDDLFPFLWNNPGVSYHDWASGKTVSEFYSTGTWWHRKYDSSIKHTVAEIERMKQRLPRAKTENGKKRMRANIDRGAEHLSRLRDMLRRLDGKLKEQKEKLRDDNT
jgi:hypothetical protein